MLHLFMRAHHLVCMLTFIGGGYTPGYTTHLRTMLEKMTAQQEGTLVTIVNGPDSWCHSLLKSQKTQIDQTKAPCQHNTIASSVPMDQGESCYAQHCQHPSVTARDAWALNDLGVMIGKPVMAGDTLLINAEFVRHGRKLFRRATRKKRTLPASEAIPAPRHSCHACPWQNLCSEIATRHFPGVSLYPESTTRKMPIETRQIKPKMD